jgi:hypothetical protein
LSHFFISYSHDDAAFVEELEERMESVGLLYWTDRKIKLGQEWRKSIDNAIHESAAVILVVTEKSMNSHYVTYEWSYAMGRDKKIVQIVLQRPKEIHPKLEPEQHMDFDYSENSWEKLLAELHELKGGHKIISAEIANAEALLDTPQWFQGITQLQDIEDDEAIEALVRGLEKKSSRVSLECAFALCEKTKYQDERALPRLELELNKLAQTLTSSDVKTKVMRFLANFGNVNAYNILSEAWKKAPEEDKNNVAHYILRIDIPENREFIKALITGDNYDMCVDAINAIQRFRYAEFSQDLQLIAQAELNRDKHYISARIDFIRLLFSTLGIIGGESSLEFLGTVFDSSSLPDYVRVEAAKPLADIGRKDAKELLSKRWPKSPTGGRAM